MDGTRRPGPGSYSISVSGYRVEHRLMDDGRRVRWIMPREPRGSRIIQHREYNPWDEPALFRRFGDLPVPLTDEAAVEFAEEYGVLGLFSEDAFEAAPRVIDDTASQALIEAEDLEDWERAIQQLRVVVDVWDTWRSGRDDANLNALIPRIGAEAKAVGDDVVPTSLGRDSAIFFIAEQVNDRTGSTAFGREMVVLPREGSDRLDVYELGPNLLSVMWAQFAMAIRRNPEYRRCAYCRRWMEIAPGSGTARREFCRPSCRTAAGRERRSRALALHDEGARAAAIAEEVGSTEQQVNRWVAERES